MQQHKWISQNVKSKKWDITMSDTEWFHFLGISRRRSSWMMIGRVMVTFGEKRGECWGEGVPKAGYVPFLDLGDDMGVSTLWQYILSVATDLFTFLYGIILQLRKTKQNPKYLIFIIAGLWSKCVSLFSLNQRKNTGDCAGVGAELREIKGGWGETRGCKPLIMSLWYYLMFNSVQTFH